jgi:hypothetical protein
MKHFHLFLGRKEYLLISPCENSPMRVEEKVCGGVPEVAIWNLGLTVLFSLLCICEM